MSKKGKYIYEWPRPMVSVDIMVFSFFGGKAKLLLIKRGKDPYKGKWAIPGGFLDIDEELKAAAARELAEETGLNGLEMEQVQTFGTIGRDPRGRQITVAFMAIAAGKKHKIKAGDDAAEAKWFDIEKLPADLAFDHNQMSKIGIAGLKRKKSYRLWRESKDRLRSC
ncbi:MAG: NUDIX domain-containing protein [Planctomycetota bacterium]|jgi:8-oxo-dGTP diphosphatase